MVPNAKQMSSYCEMMSLRGRLCAVPKHSSLSAANVHPTDAGDVLGCSQSCSLPDSQKGLHCSSRVRLLAAADLQKIASTHCCCYDCRKHELIMSMHTCDKWTCMHSSWAPLETLQHSWPLQLQCSHGTDATPVMYLCNKPCLN